MIQWIKWSSALEMKFCSWKCESNVGAACAVSLKLQEPHLESDNSLVICPSYQLFSDPLPSKDPQLHEILFLWQSNCSSQCRKVKQAWLAVWTSGESDGAVLRGGASKLQCRLLLSASVPLVQHTLTLGCRLLCKPTIAKARFKP